MWLMLVTVATASRLLPRKASGGDFPNIANINSNSPVVSVVEEVAVDQSSLQSDHPKIVINYDDYYPPAFP